MADNCARNVALEHWPIFKHLFLLKLGIVSSATREYFTDVVIESISEKIDPDSVHFGMGKGLVLFLFKAFGEKKKPQTLWNLSSTNILVFSEDQTTDKRIWIRRSLANRLGLHEQMGGGVCAVAASGGAAFPSNGVWAMLHTPKAEQAPSILATLQRLRREKVKQHWFGNSSNGIGGGVC